MNELGLMFMNAIAITFLFAGFSKAIWIKDSSRFARNLGVFPPKVGALLGFFMPIVELAVGIGMLISNSLVISILALAVIMFFIVLNLKGIIEKKGLSCFCYGNIIKTKLGEGGFIHYLYMLIAELFGIITTNTNFISSINTYTTFNLVLISSISFLIFINGMLIRLVLDKLSS